MQRQSARKYSPEYYDGKTVFVVIHERRLWPLQYY